MDETEDAPWVERMEREELDRLKKVVQALTRQRDYQSQRWDARLSRDAIVEYYKKSMELMEITMNFVKFCV